jgi:cbb3-type cytochrome oxidase maturation protein
MSVLFLLIPISLLMATAGLFACIWSIKNGQYHHLQEDQWKPILDTKLEEISIKNLKKENHGNHKI